MDNFKLPLPGELLGRKRAYPHLSKLTERRNRTCSAIGFGDYGSRDGDGKAIKIALMGMMIFVVHFMHLLFLPGPQMRLACFQGHALKGRIKIA